MPCTLCYAEGHNRRTCQRWDLLEAIRREESARIDMIHHTHRHTIAAANVAFASGAVAAAAATSAANTYDDIFHDSPSTHRTPPRRHFPVVPPVVPNAPRRMRTSRNHLPHGISGQTELVHLFQNIENVIDNDDLFSDLDSSFDWAELLNEPIPIPTPLATSTQLVDCVKEPCKALDCPICMEDFQKTDVFVTRCGHQFHGTCMIRHMKQYDNCPMCRGVLFSSSNR
jgi:hypothetical protein